MKRLLIYILLLASAFLARGQDVDQFKIVTKSGIEYYSAWLRAPDAHLEIQVPNDRLVQRGYPDGSVVTLKDFALVIRSLGDGTSLILISAHDFGYEGGRNTAMGRQDLIDWLVELEMFGYTLSDLLTNEQASAL